MRVKVEVKKMEELFDILGLKEHTLYRVRVKIRANNPEHRAFLFTGFRNGNYCEVYNNSYDDAVQLKDVYSIKIEKKLSDIK